MALVGRRVSRPACAFVLPDTPNWMACAWSSVESSYVRVLRRDMRATPLGSVTVTGATSSPLQRF